MSWLIFNYTQNRSHDLIISPASAQIAGNRFLDFHFAGAGILIQERLCSQNHTRGAVTALDGPMLNESLLQRMQTGAIRQPLDGQHFLTIGLYCQDQAGVDRPAV
jgi:hypothetical protein